MTFKYFPPRLSLFGLLILFFQFSTIQAQVGINTTTPDADAMLDVVSADKGALLPRVNLTSTAAFAPLSQHVEGMLVYNLATVNDVTPGYYYNDGTQWIRMSAGGQSDDWKTTGNAGTTAGTNFLGTTDNVHLELFTNNSTRMRIEDDGQVSIGFGATPVNADQQFNVGSNFTDGVAIGGYSGGNGAGVYGQNISSGYGVEGLNSTSGYGVYGVNLQTGQGVRGYNAGTGSGVVGRSISSLGLGVIGYNSDPSGTGIIGSGANSALNYLTTTGGTFNGTIGAAGYSTNANGTGLSGAGNITTFVYTLTSGSGVSGNGNSTGVYGIATATTGARQGAYFTMNKSGNVTPAATDDPIALLAGYNGSNYFGGYFDGNQDNTNNGGGSNTGEDYAYVGITVGTTTYKIVGTGSNSTLINDSNGNKRVLFSPEAPEILFEDYGTGKLTNGMARIAIDPLLSSAIHVSEKHPLKVFIQLEGDCNGVYVTDKSAEGFTVKELQNGQSNISFSWHIVANRANTITDDGKILSEHVGVRFPFGPDKISHLEIQNQKSETVKDEISTEEILKSSSKPELLKTAFQK